MAICTAVLMAFTMVGCKTSGVSQKEFMTKVADSYNVYVGEHSDYENFGDITTQVIYNEIYVNEVDYSYTPEGGETVVGTYQDVEQYDATATIKIKNIGNEIFITAQYDYVETLTSNEVTETELITTSEVCYETEIYELGVDGETYYARLTQTEKVNEEEPVTEKTIYTFENKDAYVLAINELLGKFNSYYGLYAYSMFGNGLGIELLLMPIEYSKEGNNYVLTVDLNAVGINEKEAFVSTVAYAIKYGAKGALQMFAEMINGYSSARSEVKLNYSADIQAITNVEEGFTAGNVRYDNAIIDVLGEII